MTSTDTAAQSGLLSLAGKTALISGGASGMGRSASLLKVKTFNTSTLEELISHIRSIDGVGRTETMVVLSTHTERSSLVLKPEQPARAAPSDAAKAPSGQKGGRGGGQAAAPAATEQHRLPPDSTTKHTLALPGRTLSFTAVAGSIRLFDDKGEPQADVAYTSYQLDDAERGARPVTFLFNGGPGASSAWLQLGDAGPWRLSITGEGAIASASPDLVPNAETWLDFTDLVFIDPVGTGYSRFVAAGEDVRRRIWSVDGDVEAIALVIRRWLEKSDRLLSPKYVVGESYGGIRGPKIVHNLQTKQGVGV